MAFCNVYVCTRRRHAHLNEFDYSNFSGRRIRIRFVAKSQFFYQHSRPPQLWYIWSTGRRMNDLIFIENTYWMCTLCTRLVGITTKLFEMQMRKLPLLIYDSMQFNPQYDLSTKPLALSSRSHLENDSCRRMEQELTFVMSNEQTNWIFMEFVFPSLIFPFIFQFTIGGEWH